MLFEVRWHLSDLIDGPEYGWDVVDWEHSPTKDELNEFITNHIDGSPIYNNLVREKMPNFFGQHVQATRPTTWRVTTIKPFKFKKGDIVMTTYDET